MIRRIIERIEDTPVTFIEAAAGFLGIIGIRFFFENFSSPLQSFPAVFDVLTLVQYALFFLGAYLSSVLVLRAFIPERVTRIAKVVLVLLPVMWLPPLIDLALSGGAGYPMAYIFANGSVLLGAFFTMGGNFLFGGVTTGIKVELGILIVAFFSYVFVKTRQIFPAIIAAVAGYVLIFIWLALPSITAIFVGAVSGIGAGDPSLFLLGQFAAGHLLGHFARVPGAFSYVEAAGTLFDLGMANILYIVDLALIAAFAALYRPGFLGRLLKNWRPERAISYFLIIVIGVFAAVKLEGGTPVAGWMDALSLAVLFLSFLFAWLFAVAVNDIVDIDIDRVSNQERPLAAGAMTEEEMRSAGAFFLIWSFLGAYLVGYWAVFAMMAFTAAYYVYSAPPLRLKRVPVVGTFLIALANLSAAVAGFYFASTSPFISAFPPQFFLLVLVFFTLVTGVKDVKDMEGDRVAGIPTIPVIFGPHRGRVIVGAALAAGFLSVPVILLAPALFLPSLVAAALGYYLVVAEPYKERRIFVLYFTYIAIAGAMLWWR